MTSTNIRFLTAKPFHNRNIISNVWEGPSFLVKPFGVYGHTSQANIDEKVLIRIDFINNDKILQETIEPASLSKPLNHF